MVIHETLRFWPLGDLERKCVKDYRDRFSFASRYELIGTLSTIDYQDDVGNSLLVQK